VHSDSFAGRFGATSFVRLLPGFRWRNADVLPILEVAVIIALTAIGLAVRLRGLVVPTRSLWIDEVFSIWLAKLPPRQAIQAIAAIDQHPPLYALLLHFWLLPRADPWWARLSSVLLGTATIPTAALLGRATGGWRLGVIAACLVTFSPELVRYSQEVRMYAMVVLLVFLATFFLVKAIEQASRRYWLGFGVTTLLLIYTHNVTLFLLPAQAAFVFWEARREPAILRSYLVTMTGVGLLWLPWLPILSHQASGVIQRFWTSAPSPGFVGTTILDFLNAFPPPTANVAGLGIPLGSLGLWLLLPLSGFVVAGLLRGPRQYRLLFFASFALPLAIDLGLSLWRPIFEERVLLYTTVGAIMLIASAIAAARSLPVNLLLLAPVLWLNVVSLNNYDVSFRKELWETSAEFVAGHAQSGDLILFNATWTQLPFDYYYRRVHGPPLVEHGLPVDLFDRGVLEPPMLPSDVPTVARLTAGKQHVWVLLSHDWYNDPQHLIRPAMRALFRHETVYTFDNILVIYYRR
jgi:mannosyltransferase